MTKRFGIFAARSKPEATELGDQIGVWLQNKGFDVVSEADMNQHGYQDTEAIVVLGGDGLMMRAASAYPDKPLLGINFGKVGFLALVEQQDWQASMTALVEGNFEVEHNSTLQATLSRGDRVIDQGWAINDVVIRSGNRMLD
ncbi:MAG: NAD(+)/NADH kinase, partial [Thermomicrobiales bacterium]